MKAFTVDMHCHPSLRAYYGKHKTIADGLWSPSIHPGTKSSFGRFIRMQAKDMYRAPQSGFHKLLDSKVQVICDALYPVEEGWINLRKVPNFMVGKLRQEEVMINATGFGSDCIHKIETTDYMETLQGMYSKLLKNSGKENQGRSFQLVSTYQEIAENLKNPDRLSVLLSIEGSHSFGSYVPGFENLGFGNQSAIVSDHVKRVKNWIAPPFYITLVHHFWNQFAGHARSLKKPFNLLYNQNKGVDKGITKIGWHFIHELLTVNNGKRILIDIKHMSVPSRIQYYEFIRSNNYLNPNNKIPIICSHTGINGYKRLSRSIEKIDDQAKFRNSYLNNWSINLCHDDVQAIHESEGLIGVMLDKSLLASPNFLMKIQTIKDPQRRKDLFLKLIWDNIFGMVEAVQEPSIWDVICLGSDFEGQISFIEFYPESSSIQYLKKDLISYLEKEEYKKNCWMGYEPKQLVKKIFQTNAMAFLKRHY